MATRTYGLSGSGMDVDQMVKDLMKARRASYDKIVQKKTQLEWKRADYSTIYSTVGDFRNNTLFNYKLQKTLLPKTAASTNETTATATASADAPNVSHMLNVTQLATGVTQTSTSAITPAGNSKDTLANQFGISGTVTFKLTNGSNSADISIDSSQSIYDLVSAINKAGINIKANYDATLDRFFLYTNNTGSTASIDFSGNTAGGLNFLTQTLKLNSASQVSSAGVASTANLGIDSTQTLASQFAGLSGTFNLKLTNGSTTKTVTIDTSQSLDKMISDLNAAGVNAQASYDSVTGKFSLKAVSGAIDLTGSDAAALSFLSNQLKLPTTRQGTDAQFMLDGVNLNQTSNNFTISGVTYNVKATGTTAVAVTPDNSKAIDAVKSFVETYNSTLKKINDELGETYYKDYLPLTDDQKSEMKDADITAWTDKAKSGLLRHDSILQDTVTKMRSDVYTPISGLTGKYTSLSSIGITTGDYSEGGKLYVDENKLKTALEEDPDIVYKLFGTSDDSKSKQGIAVRLYDTMKSTMDKLVDTAGVNVGITVDTKSAVAKQLKTYSQQLIDMNDRLNQEQDRYYKQFDAMETALSRMNQQSQWLAQQFKS